MTFCWTRGLKRERQRQRDLRGKKRPAAGQLATCFPGDVPRVVVSTWVRQGALWAAPRNRALPEFLLGQSSACPGR